MVFSDDFLFLAIATVIMVFVVWVLRRLMSKAEKRRLNRVDDVDDFEAVPTNSPHRNKRRKAKEIALISIGARFTIMRRIIIATGIIAYLFIVVLIFFDRIPVTVASLMASAAAIIIGIAARPYIENVISGFVISFADHFHTGDTVVIDGNYGTIEDISISHTIIKIWDWRRYVIPNSRMLQKDYINYSHPDQYYWAQIKFHVAYGTDLDKVKSLAVEIVKKNPYFGGYEKPRFWIMEMSETSMECWIVAWANSPTEAWNLKTEVRTELIRAFQREGIKTHFQNVSFENNGSSKTEA
ncbi:MAG: mechanosensitive ion channel family protein [Bacteroidales bacterium]|nr:mechanosensitive ion channel family protein [Bacteroidales bacterium]MCF8327991.1 mechanosensitive ion channel family protein [Bacteroidales bacterium]